MNWRKQNKVKKTERKGRETQVPPVRTGPCVQLMLTEPRQFVWYLLGGVRKRRKSKK